MAFFRFWFNDLLLMPCALPPLLQTHRWLKLRRHDLPPTVGEVAGHFLFWSLLFEAVGPHFLSRATGDWLDVLAYGAGALLAFVGWRLSYGRGLASHEL